MACKPGFVPACAGGDHSSTTLVTERLHSNLPDRIAGTHYSGPIRSCSRWGLPCHIRYRMRGALLPHPFTRANPSLPSQDVTNILSGPKAGWRFAFCGAIPRVASAGRYPAPCSRGARTFLPARQDRNRAGCDPTRTRRPPVHLASPRIMANESRQSNQCVVSQPIQGHIYRNCPGCVLPNMRCAKLIGSRDIVPGWGFGGEQPPFLPFFLPSLLFAERGQRGGLESFYFHGGLGAKPP